MRKISEILWIAANEKLVANKSNWPFLCVYPLNAICEAADTREEEEAAVNFFFSRLFGLGNRTEVSVKEYHKFQFFVFTGMKFLEAQQLRYDQIMLAHYIAIDEGV